MAKGKQCGWKLKAVSVDAPKPYFKVARVKLVGHVCLAQEQASSGVLHRETRTLDLSPVALPGVGVPSGGALMLCAGGVIVSLVGIAMRLSGGSELRVVDVNSEGAKKRCGDAIASAGRLKADSEVPLP